MRDYLPDADADFDIWLDNFLAVLKGLQSALGLAPATVNAIEASHTDFKTKFADVNTLRAQLDAAFAAKNTAVDALRASVRALVRTLQANAQLKDADRAKLQLTVPDTVRTPAPVPTTHPIAQLDVGQPLRHTGEFRDEATPSRRAKPAGVHGCEVRFQISGAEPVDPETMLTLGTFPKSPFVKDFNVADAGKTVFYYLRWVNKRGAAGPWSELVSATITKKG